MSVLALQDKIERPDIKKSTFDLSHTHSTTGKMGYLYPVLCEELVPGDFFKIRASHIIQMMPLAGKIQQRVDMYVHFFAVPMRVLHNNFKDDTTDPFETIITGRSASGLERKNMNGTNISTHSIGAYLGLPITAFSTDTEVNTLPLWGYQQIYNDYYRNKVIDNKQLKGDLDYYDDPLRRNWRKDYFTSCLPYPQLGDPSRVSIDVDYLTQSRVFTTAGSTPTDGTLNTTGSYLTRAGVQAIRVENLDELGVDVNEIRFAYAYQDWLVRMLQSGDDYAEHLKNVFGVQSSDKRLQRAEYLGGYNSPIIVNDVMQMSPVYASDDTTVLSPLGTQGGSGYTYGNSDQIEYFAEEHSLLYCIVSIVPKSMYHGGITPLFKRFEALDFFFPQFAYLPEQEVKNYEVSVGVNEATNNLTFGYIERNAEYKHKNDRISGEMVKDFKHLNFARIFSGGGYSLNAIFLKCDPREDAFAVHGDIQFFGQFGFEIEATRPMPFNVDGVNF